MKNTLKFLMIVSALFMSGNLFAQSVAEYQKRLHDLQLCENYFQNSLSPGQMTVVSDEIALIIKELTELNAGPAALTQLDNIVALHPSDEDVLLYIKHLALLTEPRILLGRDLSVQEINDLNATINSHAGKITQRY